jgi:hypothetical protein
MSERERLAKILLEIDPKMDQMDDGWQAAMFLLASLSVGCDAQEIADALEFDPAWCGAMAERARSQGIWKDGEVASYAEWQSEEDGGIAFFMDVNVLSGDINRLPDGRFQMTEEGKRRAEKMLRR